MRNNKGKTPPQPKDWCRPLNPARGDPLESTIFEAVGRALTAWEELEATLGIMYSTAIGIGFNHSLPAIRAYGSVVAFKGRSDMIAAGLEAMFFMRPSGPMKTQLQADMAAVLTRAGQFSTRRNEIAHGVVGEHPNSWQSGKDLEMGYVLLPSAYATKKKDLANIGVLSMPYQEAQYYYSALEIGGFTQHFHNLNVGARTQTRKLRDFVGC
jgi:hypothetical protein